MSGDLVLHKGARRVEETDVRRVAMPEFTDSWRPYAHGQILDAVATACESRKIEIVRKDYGLGYSDQVMFAVWEMTAPGRKDSNFALGIRNALNKYFAVGLCAGRRVFVCDNLAFASETVFFRKHSGNLEIEELVFIASEAMGRVLPRFEDFFAWHDGLKEMALTPRQAFFLAAVAAQREFVLAPSKMREWSDLYFDSGRYEPNMFGFHGALTELIRDKELNYLYQRNQAINTFIRHEVPILMTDAPDKKTFTLAAVADKGRESFKEERDVQKVAAKETNAEIRTAWAEQQKAAKTKVKEARRTANEQERERVHTEAVRKRAAKAIAKAAEVEPERERIVKSDPKGLKAPKSKGEEAVFTKAERDATGLTAIADELHKKRRTTRVKAREIIAAESKPVSTKAGKAPKGEKTKTARAAKAARAKNDADDVYFCTDCNGEFAPKATRNDKGDIVCVDCYGKRMAKTDAGKTLKALKKK